MQVEARIREIIPPDEIDTINDLEGLPTSSISHTCPPTTSATWTPKS
jgi:hypothetical protein